MKYRSLFSFIGLFVLAAAIPLTVFIGEKQQDIRQHASGATISVDPPTQDAGGVVTVSWRGIGSPTANDWIGLYKRGQQDEAVSNTSTVSSDYKLYPSSCKKLPSGEIKGSGSCPFTIPSDAVDGTYELRLFNDRSFVKYATTTLTIRGSASPSITPSAIPTQTPIPSIPLDTIPNSPRTSPTPFTTPNPPSNATPTVTPFTTPNPPSTPTQKPGSLQFALQVSLSGIGQPSGTANPKHTQRDATLTLTDTANKSITKQGTLIYNPTRGNFAGTIELNENIPEGNYTLKVQTPQFLRKQYPGIISISSSGTIILPSLTLLSGDVTIDNKVDMQDFNILISCYGNKMTSASCNGIHINQTQGKDAADLNDDGTVDGFDYNLFIRSLATKDGD